MHARFDLNIKLYFSEVVDDEAKGWISKPVFQENKARQIFRKTDISYLLIHTHTCAYQRIRNVCFAENKNVESTHVAVLLLIKLQPSANKKWHGCFSRFLNHANGTKSRKASLNYVEYNWRKWLCFFDWYHFN